MLPPGIHDATWDEFVARFSAGDRRKELIDHFSEALAALRLARCRTVYVGGSFVTGKLWPNDIDACWDRTGVDERTLHQLALALFDTAPPREAQHRLYGADVLPADAHAAPGGIRYIEFFQRARDLDERVGIVRLDLGASDR